MPFYAEAGDTVQLLSQALVDGKINARMFTSENKEIKGVSRTVVKVVIEEKALLRPSPAQATVLFIDEDKQEWSSMLTLHRQYRQAFEGLVAPLVILTMVGRQLADPHDIQLPGEEVEDARPAKRRRGDEAEDRNDAPVRFTIRPPRSTVMVINGAPSLSGMFFWP